MPSRMKHSRKRKHWKISCRLQPNFLLQYCPSCKQQAVLFGLNPGRSIIADAGVLFTRVISVKENSIKKFAIVDGGMNDLLRPSLYQAYHQIVPLSINTYETEKVDVVGPSVRAVIFLLGIDCLRKAMPGIILQCLLPVHMVLF